LIVIDELDRGVSQGVSLGIEYMTLENNILGYQGAGRQEQEESDDLEPSHIAFSAFFPKLARTLEARFPPFIYYGSR
jgi:hypothetical protein